MRLSSLWIMSKSLAITFWYSLVSLYFSRFGSRADIDRTMRKWSAALLKAVKVSYHVHNPQQIAFLPQQRYILMSNHASLYDIPLIFMALPGSIRMIAKQELFKVPVWGHAMQAAEFLAIDRKNSKQAMEDLEIVKAKMQSGIVPWIAPEGTRSRHGELNPFKKGGFMLALQTEATIIPVGIRGSNKILPPDTWDFHTGETVEIHIGEPIRATDYTVATRMEFIAVVNRSIGELVG
jgi:1-acyl-sn-glycerol-3-phosphate acyltransferase